MQNVLQAREQQRARARVRLLDAGHVALCGESAVLEATLRDTERATASDSPVLLRGEGGTGLESFARYAHAISRRSERPFVALRCGGLGTSATTALASAVVQASDGALYLDAVETLPRDAQTDLVRLLRSGSCGFAARLLVGSHVAVPAFVAALSEELAAALSEVVIEVPPLRERTDDVAEMARRLARSAPMNAGGEAVLSARNLAALRLHPWPRNLPELGEMVARLVAVDAGETPASTSGEYRTPGTRVAVELIVGDGRRVGGLLFVAHGQRFDAMLTRRERFVPIDVEGVTRLYAADAIACLTVSAAISGTHAPHGVARRVRVVLQSGAALEGELRYAAENGRSRPTDFLNGPSATFELHAPTVVHVVAKAHVEHVEEV